MRLYLFHQEIGKLKFGVHNTKAEMSEWSKEDDLRSSVLCTRGFEPRSQQYGLVVKRISLQTSNLAFRVRFPASLPALIAQG